MNYYFELLESYKKIKKRTFKLEFLGESLARTLYQPGEYDSALQNAEQIFQQIAATVPPDGNPIPIGNAGATIKKQNNGNFLIQAEIGGKKYTSVIKAANPSLMGLADSFQTNAVGSIMGPPAGSTGASAEQQQDMTDGMGSAEQPLVDPLDPNALMGLNPDEAGTAIMDKDPLTAQIFVGIENNFLKLWDKLPKSIRDLLAKSSNKAKNFFVGGRQQSIEKQLRFAIGLGYVSDEDKGEDTQASIEILKEIGEDAFATFRPEEISIDLTRGVARRLEKALYLGSLDNLSHEEKIDLRRSFSILDGKKVVVHRNTMSEGVVFSDNTGFLKNMLGHFEDKFKFTFDRKSTGHLKSASSERAIRGKVLEDTYFIATMFAQARLTGNPAFKEAGKEYLRKSVSDLTNFIAVNQDWAMQMTQGDVGISYEDYPDLAVWLEQFSELQIKGAEAVLKGITKLHKSTMSLRIPDVSIPSGKKSGIGISNDVNEIYYDYANAVAAAKRSGFSEGVIEQTTIGDMIEGNDTLTQVLQKAGVDFARPVFSIRVGLKHPTSQRETVIGNAQLTRAVSFLTGGIESLSRADLKKSSQYQQFRTKIYSSLGISQGSANDTMAKALLKKTMRGFGVFGNKPDKVLISNPTGGNIRQRYVSTRIKSFREEINRVLGYKDKFGDSVKSELYGILKDFDTSFKNETDYSERVDELSGRLKFQVDVLSNVESQATRTMVGQLIMATAGSVADQIFEYKNLKSGDSYSFEQNTAISTVLKDFIHSYPNGEWGFDIRSNKKSTKVEFKHKTDPTRVMTYDLYGVSIRREEGENGRIVNGQVKFSKNLVKHFNDSKELNTTALESKVKQFMLLQQELNKMFLEG